MKPNQLGDKVQVNITAAGETNIRFGELPPVKIKESFEFAGDIYAPGTYYASRKDIAEGKEQYIDPKTAIVEINRVSKQITLKVNPQDSDSNGEESNRVEIEGKLTLHNDISKSGIYYGEGSPVKRSKQEMIKFLRFNRRFFLPTPETESNYQKVLDSLLKLDFTTAIKGMEEEDNRANKELKFSQYVKTNVPDKTEMYVSIFTGETAPPCQIPVEISFDYDNGEFKFFLESYSLAEIIESETNRILKAEAQKLEPLVVLYKF